MTTDRFKRILISLGRFIAWIVALGVVVLLLDYSLDVSKRRSLGSVCRWNVAPNPENFPYVARYCYLTKDIVLLRLYDAQGRELLAERMYLEPNVALIVWTSDELLYRNSAGDTISLPPTIIDRLRARLP